MMAMKNAKMGSFLAVLFMVFLVSTTAGAATINVPGDYATIQAAINVAASGDTVEVAAGTYSPGTNGEVFPINMKDGVALVGAGAEVTVLDANNTNRVIYCYNVGDGTKIQGFTITHGGAIYGWSGYSGAGILVEYGSGPTIDSCVIKNNGDWSDWHTPNGGGIRIYESAPCITNCKIVDNEAVYGAGVYIYSTPPGEKVVIANCTISSNEGPGFGPGIYIYNNPTVTVVNTIAWGNIGGFYYGPPYDDVQMYWGTLSIHYCDTTYYVWYPSYSTVSASNNFYADPLFDGDFNVVPGSPCIGAGAGDLSPYAGACLPCEGANMPDVGATTCAPGPTNNPPIANAGLNVTITSEEQDITVIQGTAQDPDSDPLTYRWLEGATELQGWTSVGGTGPVFEAYLDLSLLAGFSLGNHTLTLEVSDGQLTATDDMILTVENSAPHAYPTGSGVYEICSDVILGGQVSDYDGDLLDYEWKSGEDVLFSGQIQATYGGDPVNLSSQTLPTHTLGLGEHTITLCVNDGVNEDDCANITVQVVDTTAPLLEGCIGEPTILWPPNHVMVDCVVCAHASDNSGEFTLSAEISSDEPIEGLGDGDTAPDWTEPVITPDELCPLGDDPGNGTGVIRFQLRRERSGLEDGREYTITIFAEDDSQNQSSCNVVVGVPHDMRGKK